MVRRDVPSQIQTVQAAHAAIVSATHHLDHKSIHPHLVVLGVKDEAELISASGLAELNGIKMHMFFESDLGQHVASASMPIKGDLRKVFRRYKLLAK